MNADIEPQLLQRLDRKLSLASRSTGAAWNELEAVDTRGIDFDGRPVVLMGAGSVIAQPFVKHALENYQVELLIDNARVGKSVDGAVFEGDESLSRIAHKLNRAVAVICCCSEGPVRHFTELARQFELPALSLFQAQRRTSLSGYSDTFSDPQDIARATEEFLPLLEDHRSRETLIRLCLYRLTWDLRDLEPVRRSEDLMYFQDAPKKLQEEEVLIDGGAYVGDSVTSFLHQTNQRYKEIHAFEPDFENCARLRESHGARDRVHIYRSGLWSESTMLKFDARGSLGSRLAEDGQSRIEVTAIDELDTAPITFIKLDVEGAEIAALQGAVRTLSDTMPQLAVCAYHLPFHLYDIPKLVRDIQPDYKFSFRHYSPILHDSVLYAH